MSNLPLNHTQKITYFFSIFQFIIVNKVNKFYKVNDRNSRKALYTYVKFQVNTQEEFPLSVDF